MNLTAMVRPSATLDAGAELEKDGRVRGGFCFRRAPTWQALSSMEERAWDKALGSGVHRTRGRMRRLHKWGSGGARDQSSPAICDGCRRLWWRAMGGIRGWRVYDRRARPPRTTGPLATLPEATQSRSGSDHGVQDRTGDRRFVCECVGRIRAAPSLMAPLSNGLS